MQAPSQDQEESNGGGGATHGAAAAAEAAAGRELEASASMTADEAAAEIDLQRYMELQERLTQLQGMQVRLGSVSRRSQHREEHCVCRTAGACSMSAPSWQQCRSARGAPTCAAPPPSVRLPQIKAQLFKVQRRVSALEQQLGSMAGLLEESRAAKGKAQEAVSQPCAPPAIMLPFSVLLISRWRRALPACWAHKWVQRSQLRGCPLTGAPWCIVAASCASAVPPPGQGGLVPWEAAAAQR